MTDQVRRVVIPGAPPIPGLTFRHPRFPEDYPGITEVFNAVADADAMYHRLSVEDVQHWYEHTTGWDPRVDEVIVELDGRIVGYGDVRHHSDTDGTPVFQMGGALHPDVRRRGIGTALLAYNEARAWERAEREVIEDRPILLNAWATDDGAGTIALLEGAGYQVARYFFDMMRSTLDHIPGLPMPDGLEIRPVAPGDHRRIFAADCEAFRDHWGGIDESDAAFENFFTGFGFRPDLWRVAWDGPEVAGVVMCRVMTAYNEEHGVQRVEVSGVSVRRPWRGRGLARALVADALRGARRAGLTSATLGVDVANPTGALGVYEAVGFVVDRRSRAYRRQLRSGQ